MSDVVITQRGCLGHVLLNRPQAINALTHEMVVEIAAALDAWATDDSVETVAISGAGERGLCAGRYDDLFRSAMNAAGGRQIAGDRLLQGRQPAEPDEQHAAELQPDAGDEQPPTAAATTPATASDDPEAAKYGGCVGVGKGGDTLRDTL